MNENTKIPVPNDPSSLIDNFSAFVDIVKILRKQCPWDAKQTNESIAHLMIEETYEVVDAIHRSDDADLAKELGDVLLHIITHAVIAEERKAFDLNEILRLISKKLVHRHPHVFGTTEVSGEEDVLKNWELLKMKEGRTSVLEGVPKALPALLRAERIQHKVSKVGFDWEEKKDVWAKVDEEFYELKDELSDHDKEKASQEFGDFIFSLVNAARFEGIVPEEALQYTNEKFTRRFQYIEAKAKEMNKDLNDMTLTEMDDLWNEAKKNL